MDKSYVMQVAEAVRHEIDRAVNRDLPIWSIDLAAVIASVPMPEPVGWMSLDGNVASTKQLEFNSGCLPKFSFVYPLYTFPPDATASIAELEEDMQFIERCAVHHASKMKAENALGLIQHYPAIREITKSYKDGVIPDTFNPYERIAELERRLANSIAKVGGARP